LLKRWGLGTYHGVRRKHIDTYLNDFVFRYNRRFYRHASFETLVGRPAHHVPASYWDTVSQDNPRKGENNQVGAASLHGAFGMRQDGVTPALRAKQDQLLKPVESLYVDGPGTAG
jgi:ISXO2-like transposase domain